MSRFLIDECLPYTAVEKLRTAGFEATHVRNVGLLGHSDKDILNFAVEQGWTVMTADYDFGNPFMLAGLNHTGIVIFADRDRLSPQSTLEAIVRAAQNLKNETLSNTTVVVEAGRLRFRRGV